MAHKLLLCGCPAWIDGLFHLSGVPWCVTDHWRHVAAVLSCAGLIALCSVACLYDLLHSIIQKLAKASESEPSGL